MIVSRFLDSFTLSAIALFFDERRSRFFLFGNDKIT